ncbi:MAG: hypothetical protein U1F77_05225 [Kiritimatiellia bacterium]
MIGGNAVYFDGVNTGQAGYSLANRVSSTRRRRASMSAAAAIPDLDTNIGIVESGSGSTSR